MAKPTMGDRIVEFKQKGILDRLPFLTKPYFWLVEPRLDTLTKAVNILAIDKGYRVVNFDILEKFVVVLMEKR